MTNIQAIDLLKGLEQSLDNYYGLNDEGKTAFHMAITALELFGNTERLPSAEQEFSGGLYVDGYNDGYRDGMKDAQPERLSNAQWVDFLSTQFDISRTSAKEMLHGMMRWKKEDNFKKQFSGSYCSRAERRAE